MNCSSRNSSFTRLLHIEAKKTCYALTHPHFTQANVKEREQYPHVHNFFSSKLYFHGNGSSLFLPINSSHTRIEKLYDRNTHMHTSFRVTQAGSYECVYHPHPLLLLVNKLNGIKFAIVGVVASLCVAPSWETLQLIFDKPQFLGGILIGRISKGSQDNRSSKTKTKTGSSLEPPVAIATRSWRKLLLMSWSRWTRASNCLFRAAMGEFADVHTSST